ncbi:MAG: phosphatase PAP2 family protein [Clostridia bacterium]|nr:phosphatase PAP2 family protein [Clostridia bacterium]
MEFLYWLESIRTPVMDAVMATVTHLGEETFFLVIALLVFWCVNKKQGYTLLLVGFLGIIVNQLLKLTFRIPRPWVRDPNFTVVESAVEEATGYSFPSGHTQNTVDTFGCVARGTRRLWLRIVCAVIIVAVTFSRMYLGVHTPLDVGVSLALGVLLILFVYPLLEKALDSRRAIWWVLGGVVTLSVVFLLMTELYFPTVESIDAHNLAEGQKNAYTMLGCSLAVIPVFALDRYKIKFDTAAPLLGQLLKLLLGAAIALAIKEGLKAPLELLFDGHMAARALRYFLIVVFAGTLWPMTFPLWARVGKKKNENA